MARDRGHLTSRTAAPVSPSGRSYLVALAILVAAGVTELAMGRVPICKCGYVKLWHGVVYSSENSQHLTDWYTFSHVIHGFLFYALFAFVGRRAGWSVGVRLALAVFVEAAWEVFENTPFTIERYRAVTISLDYYGDSVINSMMDILAMVAGYFLAGRLPVWVIVVLALGMEAVTAYYIRDNLLLNIVMLLYPSPAILRWQRGG